MARILLIKCSNMTVYTNALSFPMGIMSIASVLRNYGHNVRLVDLRLTQSTSLQVISDAVKNHKPDVVGLSSLTMESPSLHFAAALVKSLSPHIPVIAGGPHPTSFTEDVLSDSNINYCVVGEGEATAPELINVLLDGGDPEKIRGIALRRDGHVIFTEPRPFIDNLDSLPFPAWDLVDIDVYKKWWGMSGMAFRRYMNLFTSRACPYRCIYCHGIFGKSFRARSPENVIEEIITLKKNHNIKNFEVVDDIFNLDTERAMRIYDCILRQGLKVTFSFPNGLRCDRIDSDHLALMKRAGVHHTAVAVETASPRLQKLTKKNLNLDKVERFIEGCDKWNIYTRGFFMIGFPTETREEIIDTIRFSVRSRLHTAFFFIVIPFKGTELYTEYRKDIERSNDKFVDHDYTVGTFNLSQVSDAQLMSLQKYAYRKFYIDPMRVIRMFRGHPYRHFLLIKWPSLLRLMFRHRRGNPSIPKFLQASQ